MSGKTYLENIQYGAEHLIAGIFAERDKLGMLLSDIRVAQARIEKAVVTIHHAQSNNLPIPTVYDMPLDLFLKHNLTPHHTRLWIETAELQHAIEARTFSAQSLSGALLQLAKQGISMVHGEPKNAPEGRLIAHIPIRDLIVAARNQYMHVGEGELRKNTIEVMERLVNWKPDFFRNYRESIKAFEIIREFEWTTWERFELDMLSLLTTSNVVVADI